MVHVLYCGDHGVRDAVWCCGVHGAVWLTADLTMEVPWEASTSA